MDIYNMGLSEPECAELESVVKEYLVHCQGGNYIFALVLANITLPKGQPNVMIVSNTPLAPELIEGAAACMANGGYRISARPVAKEGKGN